MKQTDIQILTFIKKIQHRITQVRLLKNILMYVSIGLGIGAFINFISLIIPIYNALLYSIIITLSSLAVAICITMYKKPSMKMASLIGDSKGFHERLSTSLELIGKEDEISRIQKENTIEAMKEYDVHKKIPYVISKKGLILFCSFAVLFAIAGVVETPSKKEAVYKHQVKEHVKKEIEKMKEVEKIIKQSTALKEEDQKELKEILKELKEELKKAETKEELEKAMERAQKKIEKKTEQAINDEKKQENQEEIAKTANDIKKEITPDIQKKIEQAVNKTFPNTSQLEMHQLSTALSNLAKELDEQQLEALLKNMSKSQNSVNGLTEEQLQALAEQLSKMDPNNLTADGNQAGQNGGTGNESEADSGQGTGNGSDSSQGTGNGGTGMGGGTNNGNGITGVGNKNETGETGDKVTIPGRTTGNDANLVSQGGNGTSYRVNSAVTGDGYTGGSVDYHTVIGEYVNQMQSDISISSLPSAMQDIIKSYFNQINY